ncbi:hypothetical protein F2Q69_00056707 [Brassica cretica]|uniref:Uncharacterized protein n=1 Tax=Brassica cretica TaxID=69181 RepID=A0A8S9N4N7_BRACR|nr:hypothetical protein F2Q69_00056707 [Brassica cretica]
MLVELCKALIQSRRPFLWVITDKSYRSKEDGEEKEEEVISRSVVEKKEGEEVVVESGEIRRCIEEVVEEKGEEYRRNAARWRDLAAGTVREGGSSFNHLKAFADEHM